MTRRLFIASAGACFAQGHLVLEAIAAEHMPHRLIVSGIERAPIFELRDYGSSIPQLSLRPVLQQQGEMLFAFQSLADREKAWREQAAISASLRKISIYRCL